jgi:hypothetical protein
MRNTLIALFVLLASTVALAQKTEIQCLTDEANWYGELKTDFNSLHRIPYDAMFIRVTELGTCQDTIIHKAQLDIQKLVAGGKEALDEEILYSLELESNNEFHTLRMLYAEEADRRLGLFINEHDLGDSFKAFDKMLVRTAP